MSHSFDAVLIVAFGGPQGRADIRPFLDNVLRGRRAGPERVEEVVHHYEMFDGVSPLTALTCRQADGLRARLADSGMPLPVYVGMRNWHPFLADTLAEMSRARIRRALGFIAAAHRSYSGCMQYRENVAEARAEIARRGLDDVEITYVPDWHTHPGFIAANVHNAVRALQQLPEPMRRRAQLIFTAHSIPVSMAQRYPYKQQFEETARLVAKGVGGILGMPGPDRAPACVYQSRSGRPQDPWLGPEIGEYLRGQRAQGLEAAVICPVGFLCDHIEVLYDLDVEAAEMCRDIGLTMVRAAAVNDHPLYIDMMSDVVQKMIHRYESARPLQLVASL